ncbi:hypothetical protein COLO4_07258 [Corchorus olitorius]|uniref:Uncharacterized protein n=1 Tax=Corchorus olitorius TaxID=93759 RepID=A0A1R3KKL9_9ROSI|nr:hypothetical protein COLO4_07258 [Corchorus olitorius]
MTEVEIASNGDPIYGGRESLGPFNPHGEGTSSAASYLMSASAPAEGSHNIRRRLSGHELQLSKESGRLRNDGQRYIDVARDCKGEDITPVEIELLHLYAALYRYVLIRAHAGSGN